MIEPFKITPQQKNELGIIAVNLKLVDRTFNLHLFLFRRRKLKGHFPPADKVIKICRHIMKHRREFKGIKLWGYMNIAVNKEEVRSNVDMNIQAGIDWKSAQPIAALLNPALVERKP